MPKNDPLSRISTRVTSQDEQADPRQVPNSAGGWGFQTGKRERLHRFLTLGTDGGTYYATEMAITKQNAGIVLDWARNDGIALVNEVVIVSQAGRAPRNNPALFALAAAAALGDDHTRRVAFNMLPKVARIGTHLFTFAEYAQQFRGWGRAMRNGISNWYLGTGLPYADDDISMEDADRIALSRLAYQVLKYRQREGWSHRDLLRLAHPQTQNQQRNDLFRYITGRSTSYRDRVLDLPPLVTAFEQAQVATTDGEWCRLIEQNKSLTWEMLPDAALKSADVWRSLIEQGMPMTALMRQLPRLTGLGVLDQLGFTSSTVADQLADPERLRKARVHPVNVLVALRTYASGHPVKGSSTWIPVPKITDALDAAFYAAYGAVEPAGKRTMVALDVSGSMGSPVSGLPLTCREVSAALSLVIAATEPKVLITGFTSSSGWGGEGAITPLNISPRQRLDNAIQTVSGLSFGGTDCALPMLWALENKVEIDTFLVITDNETWAGNIHPHQALEQYRQKMGIPARLAVAGMTATDVTIADPADPGSMDIAGFDSSVPTLFTDFSRGSI